MKKIVMVSVLLIALGFVCTGCDGDVTRALRHDGFNVGNDIVCEAFIGKEAPEKARFLTSTHIITTNGSIYELSLAQQYSNKSNCRAADTTIKAVAIFDDKVIKATDGKFYSLVNQNSGGGAYQVIPENDSAYSIYNIILKPDDVIKASTVDSSTGIYYALKNDGNIYQYNIHKDNANAAPVVTGTTVVYSREDYGSAIVDFNYSGNSGATFVRTQETSYRLIASNLDQCSKYADIQCDYQMMESPAFAKYGDYILAYNGSMIITTYGKTFTVAA